MFYKYILNLQYFNETGNKCPNEIEIHSIKTDSSLLNVQISWIAVRVSKSYVTYVSDEEVLFITQRSHGPMSNTI